MGPYCQVVESNPLSQHQPCFSLVGDGCPQTKTQPNAIQSQQRGCERWTLRLCIPITMNSHRDYPHRIQDVSSALGAHRPSPSSSHLFSNSLFPSHLPHYFNSPAPISTHPKNNQYFSPISQGDPCKPHPLPLPRPHRQTAPLYLISLSLCSVTWLSIIYLKANIHL